MWRVASAFAMAVLTLVGGLHAGPSGGGTADAQTVPCADPRFKAAELAAYQALVKARAEARRAAEDAITALESRHKDKLAGLNLTRADVDNQKWIDRALVVHDTELRAAQDEEAKAIERAKTKYDDAIADAREQFCGQEPTGGAAASRNQAQRNRIRQAIARVAAYAAGIR